MSACVVLQQRRKVPFDGAQNEVCTILRRRCNTRADFVLRCSQVEEGAGKLEAMFAAETEIEAAKPRNEIVCNTESTYLNAMTCRRFCIGSKKSKSEYGCCNAVTDSNLAARQHLHNEGEFAAAATDC